MRKPPIHFSQVSTATSDACILWEGDNLIGGKPLKYSSKQPLVKRLQFEHEFKMVKAKTILENADFNLS